VPAVVQPPHAKPMIIAMMALERHGLPFFVLCSGQTDALGAERSLDQRSKVRVLDGPLIKTGVPVSRDPVIASRAGCADVARRQRPPTLAPPPGNSYRTTAPADRPELIYSARQKQSG